MVTFWWQQLLASFGDTRCRQPLWVPVVGTTCWPPASKSPAYQYISAYNGLYKVRVLCVYFYDWTLRRSANRDISFFLVHPSPNYILPVPFGKNTAMWLYWDPEGTTSSHNLPSSKRPCPRMDKHGSGTWKSAFGWGEMPTFRRMLVKMLVAF